MRILLTGAAGLIGQATAAHLLALGHEVHAIDLAPTLAAPHTSYARCDITDYAAVRENMRGCHAVAHLAALRSPLNAPAHEVYRVNVTGTFNVFEAAAAEGIRRVAQASSINAIGCAWNLGDFEPHYLPIDEDHPRITSDPYSFSKQQVEDIGAYFWRRDGIVSAALRFPAVYEDDKRASASYQQHSTEMRAAITAFASQPDDERQRQLDLLRAATLRHRAKRLLEYPHEKWSFPRVEGIDPLVAFAYSSDRFNLWAAVDVRDAARAVEQTLTANYEGSHALFINDRQNALRLDSRLLARLFFPNVTQWTSPLLDAESLISAARARSLIGFIPEYDHFAPLEIM